MIRKESIYLDTSVPSAYFDSRVPWRMEITREWWCYAIQRFEIYISEIVIAEIQRTRNLKRKEDLLRLVKTFDKLELSGEVEQIAEGYIDQGIIPATYFADALHIAVASFSKIDYLITWNCDHLAHAHRRKKVRLFNASAGLFIPDIITPMELMGDEDNA